MLASDHMQHLFGGWTGIRVDAIESTGCTSINTPDPAFRLTCSCGDIETYEDRLEKPHLVLRRGRQAFVGKVQKEMDETRRTSALRLTCGVIAEPQVSTFSCNRLCLPFDISFCPLPSLQPRSTQKHRQSFPMPSRLQPFSPPRADSCVNVRPAPRRPAHHCLTALQAQRA